VFDVIGVETRDLLPEGQVFSPYNLVGVSELNFEDKHRSGAYHIGVWNLSISLIQIFRETRLKIRDGLIKLTHILGIFHRSVLGWLRIGTREGLL
jgi:hypothetical protein